MIHGRTRGQHGLTLVEILLVLVIIGLGWFTLLPKLNLADRQGGRGSYAQLNDFMAEVRRDAQASGLIQVVEGEAGRDKLSWKKNEVKLPGLAGSVTINDRKPQDQKFSFRVYPDGLMDSVALTFPSGEAVESRPLSCRFGPPQNHENQTMLRTGTLFPGQ